MNEGASVRYIVLFILAALGSAVITLAVQWGGRAGKCRPHVAKDVYLAYCAHPEFGDYEHAAYYMGLDRKISESLREADVLFLGNSRTQFGFSTDATRRYFQLHGLRFHIFGFGYGESGEFPIRIIETSRLRPRVIVINVDGFFNEVLSPPAQEAVSGGLAARTEYLSKMVGVWFAKRFCGSFVFRCSRDAPAIYRSSADGSWRWEKLVADPDARHSATDMTPARWAEAQLDEMTRVAERFMKRLNISKECIVLTAAPTSYETRTLVAGLGRRLRWTVVYPDAEGLFTIDGSHLNRPSAELWSTAFLPGLDDVLRKCPLP